MPSRLRIFLSVASLTLFGFVAGVFANSYFSFLNPESTTQQVRKQGSYRFINPLYECEVEGEEFLAKYVPFENKIKSRIENEVSRGLSGEHLSVYFRNLNNGPWFGINERENFSPASLLKVPLMMAYFKKSESDSVLLQKNIVFEKSQDDYLWKMQQIVPANRLQGGEAYPVEELIRRMIVYSDNDAMALLTKNFSQKELYGIYAELGVPNPYAEENNVISVKNYASFFRILYNAAYLNRENSEKALALLAQTDFRGALTAGIPKEIMASHKFGERELPEGELRNQFHDCGIVYYEKYPYLLCVMTRGNDKDKLINIIQKISRITFEEISRSYP